MVNLFEDMAGRVALITGATGGIGAEIAKVFVNLGVKCVLTGTNEAKIEALRTEYEGKEVLSVKCNIANEEESRALVKQAIEYFGGLDYLVCNAGITKDNLSIKMPINDWNDVINVNLTSCFIMSQEAIKFMMRKKFGRIIFISSVVGQTGNPGQANYVASKAGLMGLAKSLAAEYASRNITVNCVAPGFIETNMTDKLNEAQSEVIKSKIPMGRYGNPRDIANAVAFLASNLSSYITGETISVNGGMFMN
jgi:3-oxoacyl-[acyl-carrier protein] reductase